MRIKVILLQESDHIDIRWGYSKLRVIHVRFMVQNRRVNDSEFGMFDSLLCNILMQPEIVHKTETFRPE
jgi:hypothetical protein